MTDSLIIKRLFLILLSVDCKIKTMLDGLCWFNSVNALAENDIPDAECMDIQMAQSWSCLWDCAGEALCVSVRQRCHRLARFCAYFPHALLRRRKCAELAFSFRNSSLHQLLVCRHASGSDGDNHIYQYAVHAQSTMRVLAIVLFLLPESKRIRYVHCLCCGLSNGGGPYLYGCGIA
ncbi:hypothetical protein [Kluyvera ascorbata]|uniref:hypothetical protein n=1 Tax=Kluyvera ascorbata TaxID=51288 RepID=UPI0039F6FF8E